MILEGAPVTGLVLIVSSISTALVRGQYGRYRTAAFAMPAGAAALSPTAVVKRLLLTCIPIGPLALSVVDACIVAHLVGEARTLERRWGSNSFLAYVLSSACLGIAAVQLLVTEGGSKPLSIDAVRIFAAAGTLVPLSALLLRHLREVPASLTFLNRFPGTSIPLTDKTLSVLLMLRLVFWPDTQLEAASYRRGAVLVDVGVWVRLVCVLLGCLFASLSTRAAVLQWWLRWISRCICRPLLAFLRPLTDALFGLSFTADHAKPRHLQQQPSSEDGVMGWSMRGLGQPTVMDDGRYVVDSLSGANNGLNGNAALQEVRARMRERRHGRNRASENGGAGGGAVPGGPRSAAEEAARASALAAIEALGLSRTRDEILSALDMTDGNMEMAVQILLS